MNIFRSLFVLVKMLYKKVVYYYKPDVEEDDEESCYDHDETIEVDDQSSHIDSDTLPTDSQASCYFTEQESQVEESEVDWSGDFFLHP